MTDMREIAEQDKRDHEDAARSMRRSDLVEGAIVGDACIAGSVLAVMVAGWFA